MMKRKLIYAIAPAILAVSGCYEPYVLDYDLSGVYIANQYDLRSVVVGEGMSFEIGAVLGGVITNGKDRKVNFTVDDGLLSADLSEFGGTTAFEGLTNSPSQSYVSSAISEAALKSVTPLPKSLYSLSDDKSLIIAKGRHTGTVTFRADSLKFISDPNVSGKPYYAFAWKITSADADTVLLKKSFGIVAVRLENMFFGDWYHGGRSTTFDSSGKKVASTSYATAIPSVEGTSQVYSLTTSGAYTCSCNYMHNTAGTMTIGMDGHNVTVSGSGIEDMGCGWNAEKHLQNRKIYLNYKYSSTDGGYTEVHDTLTFRARIRDGVNEWQN